MCRLNTMTEKAFFYTFLLGVALGEWVEITKVGNTKTKETGETYTHSSYEITLNRPQFYDITNKSLPAIDQDMEKLNDTKPEILEPPGNLNPGVETMTNINVEDYSDESEVELESREDDDDYDESEEETEGDASMHESRDVMLIVKHVQDQLLDYRGRSLDAKAEHLKKLRDNILYEIKHRISQLFKRQKGSDESDSRLYKDYFSEEHYMDYPSNEGALMTIGFLTFAVFLIKLVLKLIYAFKVKQQYYYQTTTTPVSIFLKRDERELDRGQLDQSARILRYLEEYSPSKNV